MIDYKEYFKSKYPEEAGGYIKGGEFYPIENLAEDKINYYEFDGAVLIQEPELILHSHTKTAETGTDDLRIPTVEDMEGQLLTAVEWGICVTDGQTCTDPICWGNPDHRPPLIEREFIPNVQDCLSLVQDWMYEKLNIRLPNYPRHPDWDLHGKTHMEDLYKDWGFETEIAWEDMSYGDLLMLKCVSATPNHLAIYVGDGKIIHHGLGQISVIEPVHRWKKRLVRIVRHKEIK